ncbi:MAG: hypothetical protein U5Q03_12435 [Bacteroidota bacterium]|nr:hypothetical protein [Bacteroidota bacterium]
MKYKMETGLLKRMSTVMFLWQKTLSWDNATVVGSSVQQASNGDLVLASSVYSEVIGLWPMISKLDACGEKLWCRVIPEPNAILGQHYDVCATWK